jgi:hypothetical protein
VHEALGGAFPKRHHVDYGVFATIRKVPILGRYSLPPFDASQEVKKLASWDILPSDAKVETILPLLSRIKSLKGGQGGALSGMQLMAFFIQRRVHPYNTALPNFGITSAWKILPACLKI